MSRYQPSAEELIFLGFRTYELKPAVSRFEGNGGGLPLDIESLILKLCLYLQEDKFDGRLASLLLSWMKAHGGRVHLERLKKLRDRHFEETGDDVLWLRYFAYFNVFLKRHQWKTLTKAKDNKKVLFASPNKAAAALFLKSFGLEQFLPRNSNLKVHRDALRLREEDVLDENSLMAKNRQYYNRVLFGANVRSDVATFMGYFPSTSALSSFLGLTRGAVRRNMEDLQKTGFESGAARLYSQSCST